MAAIFPNCRLILISAFRILDPIIGQKSLGILSLEESLVMVGDAMQVDTKISF